MRLRLTAALPSFDDISRAVDRYTAKKQIYNVDYQQLNRDITRATEQEGRQIRDRFSEIFNKGYNGRSPEEQELIENLPSWGRSAFELLRDAAKARKTIKSQHNLSLVMPYYERWEPLCQKFLALKPYIIKGREVSETPSQIPLRTLDNTGSCAVCGRNVKLHRGKIMDHGYTKGFGWRHGICFGAGYQPFEISPEGLIAYKAFCEKRLAELPHLIELRAIRVAELRAECKANPLDQKLKGHLGEINLILGQLKGEQRILPEIIEEAAVQIRTWKAKPLPQTSKG